LKVGLVLLGLASGMLGASAASAKGAEAVQRPPASSAAQPIVEIRVNGDAVAIARVRMTAAELLSRLEVTSRIKSIDEIETSSSEPTPLVVAYVDLRNVPSPSIDIEDGKTRQELTRRNLSDVATLENGVEAVMHVLYLSVESALQVAADAPAASEPPPASKKPVPPAPSRRSVEAGSRLGVDVGPLLRLSSLGGSRIVPGGGIAGEGRLWLGRVQLGLMLSGAVHGTSELAFQRGETNVRLLQARLVPTLDWSIASEVSGCVGLGFGLDGFMMEPAQAPEAGGIAKSASRVDAVFSALLGARVPITSRVFLSALGTLDLDPAPTAFVAVMGAEREVLLQLPRLRAGFTLALSLTAAGARRFPRAGAADR
jgi:hypothetical protein